MTTGKIGYGFQATASAAFDYDLFNQEPFDKFHAYLDLCKLCAYMITTVSRNGRKYKIGPGQLLYSENWLAKKWKWCRQKVRRFIDDLVERKIIQVKKSKQGSLMQIEEKAHNTDEMFTKQSDNDGPTIETSNDGACSQTWTPEHDNAPTQPDNEMAHANTSNDGACSQNMAHDPATIYRNYQNIVSNSGSPHDKEKPKPQNTNCRKPEGIPTDLWTEFVAHKVTQGATVRAQLVENLRAEGATIGWSLERVLRHCLTLPGGFRAEFAVQGKRTKDRNEVRRGNNRAPEVWSASHGVTEAQKINAGILKCRTRRNASDVMREALRKQGVDY